MAHTHYKGTGKVHSFRGLLADAAQRKIRIQGPVGSIAWRISKFEVLPAQPTSSTTISTVSVWREEQASVVNTLDFDDDELLAATMVTTTSNIAPFQGPVFFDNSLFSRNIWVTQQETSGNGYAINYYIELEEVKLSAAGMAQLAVAAARRTIG